MSESKRTVKKTAKAEEKKYSTEKLLKSQHISRILPG